MCDQHPSSARVQRARILGIAPAITLARSKGWAPLLPTRH
jgi:hypothetical protein